MKVITIKDGEKYKNKKTVDYILNELLKNKIERKDTVVAFGGGVAGDIAGYCASIVLRGVNLVQIPTTLLAMCDSSIGGKTGYNTKYGKNLAGSFYFASNVLIDPCFLETLNEKEYKCAMGEIIKYAMIEKSSKCEEDYNLFEFLSEKSSSQIKDEIERIIEISASIKASVVQKDKFEGGLRKILNFAHTYAHSFEVLSNYKKMTHGEAVAYGIKYASKLGLDLGKINKEYYDKIISLIDKFGLAPNKLNFNKKDIIEKMKQDKKVQDKKINLLVPVRSFEVELFDNIEEPLIEASLL